MTLAILLVIAVVALVAVSSFSAYYSPAVVVVDEYPLGYNGYIEDEVIVYEEL